MVDKGVGGTREVIVRTTLDIEEDVLLAAREIARQRGLPMGKVLSDLARQALTRESTASTRHGVPLFPSRPDGGVVTLELVNQLRDETP
jgi:hypothetical protein